MNIILWLRAIEGWGYRWERRAQSYEARLSSRWWLFERQCHRTNVRRWKADRRAA